MYTTLGISLHLQDIYLKVIGSAAKISNWLRQCVFKLRANYVCSVKIVGDVAIF